eukprot:6184260-Pleurochrysis_carterae.AAC.1
MLPDAQKTGCTPTRDHADIKQVPEQSNVWLPCRAILHAQRNAETAGTARNIGQAIFKWHPEPVAARANCRGGAVYPLTIGLKVLRWCIRRGKP